MRDRPPRARAPTTRTSRTASSPSTPAMSAPLWNVSWTTETSGSRVMSRRTRSRVWTSLPGAAAWRAAASRSCPATKTWDGNPVAPATMSYGTSTNAEPVSCPGKRSIRPDGLTRIGSIPARPSVTAPEPMVREASGDASTEPEPGMPGTSGASLR